MVGEWEIMRLLGRYRDQEGAAFRLGRFHDRLISYGSLMHKTSRGRSAKGGRHIVGL
jgi:hypothetical protein